jgi:glucose-1-phosphate adenylyltransferase
MRKTIAIIFAGAQAEEMSVLTFWRPKSAVIFGGAYRMIDFALTNLAVTAGIDYVGILSQYRPSSLIDHVGIGLPWDFVGNQRGVRFLPPHLGPDHADWYRGTADALYQNVDFLKLHAPDDVLIVSGDHAYSMDYGPLLRFHLERDADVTLAFTPIEHNPSRFGIGELNAEGRIMSYREKPKAPRSNLASMTVYVFKRQILIEELERFASLGPEERKSFHIYDEILPHMMEHRRAFGWIHRGPWEYARTLDAYHQAHQDMLGPAPRLDLAAWNVRTNPHMRRAAVPPPTHHGPAARVVESIVSQGCVIEGSVERSVLSPDVRIARGAEVRNSILWDRVTVEEGAFLDGVVCDKRCIIRRGARIGVGDGAPPNADLPGALTCGATVLGMDVEVPSGAEIGRNCVIHPKLGPKEIAGPVPSGTTVKPPGVRS